MSKKVFALILVSMTVLCLIPVSLVSASENAWVQKASMGVARSYLGVAVVDDKIYAIGGSTQSGLVGGQGGPAWKNYVGTNEVYDPNTNTWANKTSMPIARGNFAIAAYEGKIYCIGGKVDSANFETSLTTVNEVYNPNTDSWTTKAPMPPGRAVLKANIVSDKIYVIGIDGNLIGFVDVYDPKQDSWVTKAPIPYKISGFVSAAVGNRIFVFAIGNYPSWDFLTLIYNTVTDTWTKGATALNKIGGAAASTTGEFAPKRIYLFAESKPHPIFPSYSTQAYDEQNDSWSNGTDVTVARKGFAAATVNDKIYTIGGHYYDDFGFINPCAENWQYTPVGYGAPDPAYQTPTTAASPTASSTTSPEPSPSTSPTSSALPSTSPSATVSVAPTPTLPTPSSTQNLTPTPSIPEVPIWTAILIAIIAGTLLWIFKKKNKNCLIKAITVTK